MTIDDYFAIPWDPSRHQRRGRESKWLLVADIDMTSGEVWLGDPTLAPSLIDGIVVELARGVYRVEMRIMDYGDDRRVSRFRLVLAAADRTGLGAQIGMTGTDTALIGVIDNGAGAAFDSDETARIVDRKLQSAEWYARIRIDEPALDMVAISSGFGDGEYRVFEIRDQGARAGLEIEFIGPHEPYPD